MSDSYEQQLAQAARRLRNAKEAKRQALDNEHRLAKDYAKAKAQLSEASDEVATAEAMLIELATADEDVKAEAYAGALTPTARALLEGVSRP